MNILYMQFLIKMKIPKKKNIQSCLGSTPPPPLKIRQNGFQNSEKNFSITPVFLPHSFFGLNVAFIFFYYSCTTTTTTQQHYFTGNRSFRLATGASSKQLDFASARCLNIHSGRLVNLKKITYKKKKHFYK